MINKQIRLFVIILIALLLVSFPSLAAIEVLEEEWSMTVDQPSAISINPNNGYCWIAGESIDCEGWYEPDNNDSIIVRYPPDSVRKSGCDENLWWCNREVMYRVDLLRPYIFEDFRPAIMLSVNKNNDTCWLAELGQVLHLDSDGNILHVIGPNTPHSLSVYYADGSCWVANGTNEILHINSSGSIVWLSTNFNTPMSVSVNQTDGSCWVADSGHAQVVHLSSSGVELWRGGDFLYPSAVSVNSTDGSCWVTDSESGHVVRLSSSGEELWRVSLANPHKLAVNSKNGDCWVAATSGLYHLNPDGSTRSVQAGAYTWTSLSVNTADDSICLAEKFANEVVNLRPVCSPFEDVLCWHWAIDAIVACYDAQLVLGYYIARSIADPTGEEGLLSYTPPTTPTFPDVPDTFWAYKHIEYLAGQDIVKGYEDNKYHPENPVTRDQMAVYITRAFNLPIS